MQERALEIQQVAANLNVPHTSQAFRPSSTKYIRDSNILHRVERKQKQKFRGWNLDNGKMKRIQGVHMVKHEDEPIDYPACSNDIEFDPQKQKSAVQQTETMDKC